MVRRYQQHPFKVLGTSFSWTTQSVFCYGIAMGHGTDFSGESSPADRSPALAALLALLGAMKVGEDSWLWLQLQLEAILPRCLGLLSLIG